jgi:hypothetical protein
VLSHYKGRLGCSMQIMLSNQHLRLHAGSIWRPSWRLLSLAAVLDMLCVLCCAVLCCAVQERRRARATCLTLAGTL